MTAAPPAQRRAATRRRSRGRRLLWRGLAALAMLVAFTLGWALWPERLDPRALPPGAPRDVRVLRDTWGIPHVFGRTDADVAFGLGWAHAEDDFATIQVALAAARGQLASRQGPAAAPNDYLVALLRLRESVDEGYARDLAPETRAVLEAYAAGLNAWARRHPADAWPELFPVEGRDIVAGFAHKLPLFFGLHRVIQELLAPTPPSASPPPGSTAVAIAPGRSADRHTRLLVNSHQPWEGPVAWYEAHLRSDEGWDAYGGLFPGSPVVLHGFNRDLGWAHTVNRPDLVDVYALETAPGDPLAYRFGGTWRRLERRSVTIRLGVLGRLRWPVERETLWSVHGPVVRGPRGTFAVRAAGLGDARPLEQWYRMNRARSREQWLSALAQGGIPMFNCVYATGRGQVGYVYNARLPLRAPGFDWRGTLPGDSPDALWSEHLPFERLPAVHDPPSGFVQNANSSPFQTTLGPGNPDPGRYPPSLGLETRMTNRALRLLELLGQDESISADELLAYKYDTRYSTRSALARSFRELLAGPEPADPLAAQAVSLLRGWQLGADPGDRAAALALDVFAPAHDDRADDAQAARSRLVEAATRLRAGFGRIDPRLDEVQRLQHGAVDRGLGGAPDVLHAVYTRPGQRGRRVAHSGDSLVLLVDWDADGRVSARAVQPFGAAPNRLDSPHRTDQAALFASRQLRPVWLEEADIRAHLESELRLGASGPVDSP